MYANPTQNPISIIGESGYKKYSRLKCYAWAPINQATNSSTSQKTFYISIVLISL